MNDVIVSGLKIKPRSFAQAVKGLSSESNPDLESTTEEQVTTFLRDKKINIDTNSIEACHILPTKSQNDKPAIPAIIMRFVNRKHKVELLKQWKKLENTNVYLNEHLTKKNAEIAKKARALKKQGKLKSTWTASCKVFVKPVDAAENSYGTYIKSIDQLEKYDKDH